MSISRKLTAIIAVCVVIAMIATLSFGCKKEEKAGGEFRLYINEPVSIDPPNSYESEGIQVVRQVWDGLVEYDPETLEVVPAIADTWDVSDDGLVYTINLKKGVKFHSGRECTAEDFVYSWTRAVDDETASYLAYHLAPIVGYDEMQDGSSDTFEGVKALDDYTLEVTLKYPYADFIKTLGHVVFYPVAKEDIEEWGDLYAEHVNGTGAFKFIEWKHDQYITLERFDDYYGETADLDNVKYVIFADYDTAFLEFQAGNIEYTSIPQGKIQSTLNDPVLGEMAITGPELAIYYFSLNFNAEPFKGNKALREAISYAVDRQNIIDVVMEGLPTPATGIVPKGIPGYQENASEYTYDVEMAKQKLEEAGYPGGEGLDPIVFGINIGSGHEMVAEAVQADLAEIGIEVEIEGMEWGAALEAFQKGEIGFHRLGWLADYPTMDNFLYPLFHSESADNYCQYNNPEVDRMLIEARSTRDEEERIEKYREIERIICDDAAFILIYFYAQANVLQPYVKGFHLDAMGNYDLSTVELEPKGTE
jgi:oligopeptide transport system substrate-binding protein